MGSEMCIRDRLSIKSINDFLQDYLAYANTPAHLLPQYITFRRAWQKEHPCRIRRVKHWLHVPSYCSALWSSIRYLLIGFLCGIYLLYGWTYAIAPGLFAVFFYVDYRRTCNSSFQYPRKEFAHFQAHSTRLGT